MADRIFTSGAEAAEAAHFPPRTPRPAVQWEYQEVRFLNLDELQAYGKSGWEFFHIESQAGGYRKALGKRLCST